jgi:hypothetical protein
MSYLLTDIPENLSDLIKIIKRCMVRDSDDRPPQWRSSVHYVNPSTDKVYYLQAVTSEGRKHDPRLWYWYVVVMNNDVFPDKVHSMESSTSQWRVLCLSP